MWQLRQESLPVFALVSDKITRYRASHRRATAFLRRACFSYPSSMRRKASIMADPRFSYWFDICLAAFFLLYICLADISTDDNGRRMIKDNERRALLIIILSHCEANERY